MRTAPPSNQGWPQHQPPQMAAPAQMPPSQHGWQPTPPPGPPQQVPGTHFTGGPGAMAAGPPPPAGLPQPPYAASQAKATAIGQQPPQQQRAAPPPQAGGWHGMQNGQNGQSQPPQLGMQPPQLGMQPPQLGTQPPPQMSSQQTLHSAPAGPPPPATMASPQTPRYPPPSQQHPPPMGGVARPPFPPPPGASATGYAHLQGPPQSSTSEQHQNPLQPPQYGYSSAGGMAPPPGRSGPPMPPMPPMQRPPGPGPAYPQVGVQPQMPHMPPPASSGGVPPLGPPMPPHSTGGQTGGPWAPPMPPGPPGPHGPYPGAQQQPGLPPQPGMPPPQSSPSRSLDPDQMPSAVQVIEEDKRKNSGPYETGQQLGLPPPLVTTDYLTVDRGACSPRYIRSTLYTVPCTADLLKSTGMPLGLIVSPMAHREPGEAPLYTSDLGACGPVRCIRCKAYMSPYMTWLDGGRRFQCALCGGTTDTPETYFTHLDQSGRRMDTYQRPELHLGSYEMVATTEYCKGGMLPGPPGLVFMIDVGFRAVRSGLTALVCAHIRQKVLSLLPAEEGLDSEASPLRVGFVTYDRVIHYYNLNPGLSQPQMMLVTDLEDVFVPLVDGFLVDPAESESQIGQLLETIPQLFKDTAETETILGPVIESGIDAFKSAQCPGKLLVFHSGLPTAEAPGRLKNRDDRKLLGSDKEKTVLSPASEYYTRLGQRCVEAGVGVDMFVCCDAYVDVASIGQVPFISGGSLYKYTYFQAGTHGRQLTQDLEHAVHGSRAFDCVMRVRTSAGTRPVDFYGGMYMANTTDVEVGSFGSDKAIAVEVKHDDKLAEGEPVLVQCALLYTSVSGQRRLRIHNLALATSAQMPDVFRSAELDALVNLLAKSSLHLLLKRGPKEVREALISRCSSILAAYRKNCANNTGPGQLILPEPMKLLPLYVNAIIKNDAFQGGSDISTDDRSYLMYLCESMDVAASNVFFYPRLMPLHELPPPPATDAEEDASDPAAATALPPFIRCSVERLEQRGVYLLDNGIVMFMWLGPGVDLQWVSQVFGVNSLAEINPDRSELPDLDTPQSRQIRGIVDRIRRKRRRHLKLYVVRARDKLEPWFLNFLVEDRGISNGSTSYVDFLLHIHKEIRSILS